MKKLFRFVCVLLLPLAAVAHVNSPDVYFDGYAGPYHLLVTMRPPAVVPGVAQIEVRTVGNDVDQIKILPLRMIGVGAKMAPVPDLAKRSVDDPQLFTGSLWIMVRGSWKVADTGERAEGRGATRCASSRSFHQLSANATRPGNFTGGAGTGAGSGADRHYCCRHARRGVDPRTRLLRWRRKDAV